MAEIMEREELAPDTAETAPKAAEKPKGGKWKNMPRKKRRRIIRWCVILVILAVIGGVLFKLLGGKSGHVGRMIKGMIKAHNRTRRTSPA